MTDEVLQSGELGREPIDPDLGLGEFLTFMCQLSNSSQAQLADYLKVSQQSVSRWISGKSKPTGPEHLESLKGFFGLSDNEVESLIEKNEPRTNIHIKRAQGAKGARRVVATHELTDDPRAVILGAFAIRIQAGPPLNSDEIAYLRDLTQTPTVENPATPIT